MAIAASSDNPSNLVYFRQIIFPVEWEFVLQSDFPRSGIKNDVLFQRYALLFRRLHSFPRPRDFGLGDCEPDMFLGF